MIFRVCLVSAVVAASAQGAGKLDFNRDIRPILSDNCFACHGLDAKKRKADLRLDLPEGAFTAIDGVFPIKPGDPEMSSIIQRIVSTDEDEVMPPPDSHKKVTPAQVEILKRWIKEGAEYKKHWAFEAPVKAAPPPVKGMVKNGIDAFIQAQTGGGKAFAIAGSFEGDADSSGDARFDRPAADAGGDRRLSRGHESRMRMKKSSPAC
jgi:hypothetical protein